jgi:putative heme-binding domain-containing protein
VATAAHRLARVPFPAPNDDEIVAAVQALRRLGDDKAEAKARDEVMALLRLKSGRKLETAKAYVEWFELNRPDLRERFVPAPGYDAGAWRKRLAGVKWDAGDVAAGKKVFVKATCAACHGSGLAVGPSLEGVAKRFNRDDLLTAVLDPNRDVPARYRATRLNTDDGKVYDGIVIYEAVDGVILQTGPDATVRVAGDRIESRKPLTTSVMPSGLLDRLTDAEIADLLAYLRTL